MALYPLQNVTIPLVGGYGSTVFWRGSRRGDGGIVYLDRPTDDGGVVVEEGGDIYLPSVEPRLLIDFAILGRSQRSHKGRIHTFVRRYGLLGLRQFLQARRAELLSQVLLSMEDRTTEAALQVLRTPLALDLVKYAPEHRESYESIHTEARSFYLLSELRAAWLESRREPDPGWEAELERKASSWFSYRERKLVLGSHIPPTDKGKVWTEAAFSAAARWYLSALRPRVELIERRAALHLGLDSLLRAIYLRFFNELVPERGEMRLCRDCASSYFTQRPGAHGDLCGLCATRERVRRFRGKRVT